MLLKTTSSAIRTGNRTQKDCCFHLKVKYQKCYYGKKRRESPI